MQREKNRLKQMAFQRSACPVACALDIIGDKWTMLVIRDMLRGKSRFSEFMESEEGIKTNILTDRLKRLEQAGLVTKHPYQTNPPRFEYQLTDTGKDVWPVIKAIIQWSNRNIPGTRKVLKE